MANKAGNFLDPFGGMKPKKKPNVQKIPSMEALDSQKGSSNLVYEKGKNQLEKLESRYKEKIAFHTQRVRREEKELYSKKNKERQDEIAILKQEVEAISKQTKDLSQELQIAVEQKVINPGASDVSFIQALIRTVLQFRKKIEAASLWLSQTNQKRNKKGAFWGNVKKSGTQYLTSSEHYVSRSAG